MASILTSILPTFVIECLPLILATTIYEVQIVLYLFFDHPTRPQTPFESMDSVSFLPWEVPKYAESWLGYLVATTCGVIWFFSEFALDLVAIALDNNIENREPTMVQGSSPEQRCLDLQFESYEELEALPVEASSRSQRQNPKIRSPKTPQLTAHPPDGESNFIPTCASAVGP